MNKSLKTGQVERAIGGKTNQLIEKQDFLHIAILAAIALVIGVYLIATTILINKDGVVYIEQAQKFSNEPSLGVRGAYPLGYPFLIYTAHRIAALISNSASVEMWIYSAQSVSLLCRLLSLIPLYFIGKLLVGTRNSYLALLILIFLPYPAEYGSEIVREWPHLFFLATAFLFLLLGTANRNWRMFAVAGLFSGIGYTIRPECGQIVLYGMLWLLVGLFIPRPDINRLKAISLTVILIIGFLIPAVPYSIIRGEVLPPKLKAVANSDKNLQSERIEKPTYMASVMPKDILMAVRKLTERIGENLMYFFMPPLIVGFYYHFRKLKELLADCRLFISALVILYVTMMLLLHINFGYISRRHFMPMIVFTVFYIPAGLLIIADWISGINIKGNEDKQKNTQKWFFILLTTGMLICLVKLSGLTSAERKGYREAAKWLKENTAPADIIAVPDPRISFYAERKGVVNGGNYFTDDIKYAVITIKEDKIDLNEKIAFCDINIVKHPEKCVAKELFLKDFKERNPQIVSLNFSVPEGKPLCEFRVYLFSKNDITLQTIDLRSIGSSSSTSAKKEYDLSDTNFSMSTQTGIIDPVSHQIKSTTKGFLAYGPYIPLSKGNYAVNFQIKLNNPEDKEDMSTGMTKIWSATTNNKKEAVLIYGRR